MKFNAFSVVRWLPITHAYRLRLQRRLLERGYEKAKRTAAKTDLQELWQDWQFQFQMHDDEENRFHSNRLLERARRLRLPRPAVYVDSKISEDYERSVLDGSIFLSNVGEAKLRAAIREEEKYQAERWTRRLTWFTAVTGLVGTVTGLVAVLHHSR